MNFAKSSGGGSLSGAVRIGLQLSRTSGLLTAVRAAACSFRATALGVPAGAKSPIQAESSIASKPCSPCRRNVWQQRRPHCAGVGDRYDAAAFDEGLQYGHVAEHDLRTACQEIRHPNGNARLRHVDQVDPGHLLQLFAAEVRGRALPTESTAQRGRVFWPLLQQLHQLAQAVRAGGRERWLPAGDCRSSGDGGWIAVQQVAALCTGVIPRSARGRKPNLDERDVASLLK